MLNDRMRAVTVHQALGKLRLVDRPDPPLLGPHQVRVRVIDVGVCGTDREIAALRYGGAPPAGQQELVLGHEALGEVVQVGVEVASLAPGQLVVPMVRRPCDHPDCLPCRHRRPDFCASGAYLERGIQRADGFLMERFVDDQEYLQPLPDTLRSLGVLVEPLSLAQKAIAQYWNVQSRLPWLVPGHAADLTALVLGAGPVGLLGALVLVAHGFRTTLVARGEGPDPRSDFAESIGARYLDAEAHSPDEVVAAVGSVDLVYEASGASPLSLKIMERFGPNGIFILTGVPGRKAPVAVDVERLMRNVVLKNQLVFASVAAARADYAAAVRDLELFRRRWPDALASLISGRYPVEQYAELLSSGARDMKEVLSFEV